MPSRQRGYGLVEVAVSLLVLSIAALGLGRLQIAATRMGYEAVQRTEAAALAMDLLERLRTNRAAVSAYGVVVIAPGGALQLPAPSLDCNTNRCSSVQLKDWDLWQWAQGLSGAGTGGSWGGLMQPTACVVVSGRRVTVEVAWAGFRSLSAPLLPSLCGPDSGEPGVAGRPRLQMSSWIGEEHS